MKTGRIAKASIFLLAVLLMSAFVFAYPVSIIVDGDRLFTTEVYRCSNPSCSGTFTFIDSDNGDPNTYILPGSGSQTFAEYDFTPGFLAHAYFVTTDPSTSNGPHRYTVAFTMKQDCQSRFNSFSLSSNSVNVGQQVTINAQVRAATEFDPSGPQNVPSSLQSVYSDRVNVLLLINGNQVESREIEIPWEGSRDVSFTFTPTATGSFTIQVQSNMATDPKCTNTILDNRQATLTVNGGGPGPISPTVDLDIDGQDGPLTVNAGTTHTLSWTSSNANTCSATGSWLIPGNKPLSGSESTGVVNVGTPSYTLTCSGPGGTASDTVVLNVIEPQPSGPSVDLDIDGQDGPITVQEGTSHLLSWVSSNANSCSATGDWITTGPKPLIGSESTGILGIGTRSYTLTCIGAGGSASDTVLLNVVQAPSPPEIIVNSLQCFDPVIVNNNQSCSVFVEDRNGAPVPFALVNLFLFPSNIFWGSCITDRISGGCETKRLETALGTFTVYATAELGTIIDSDAQPQFTYSVIPQRYNIINLRVFNDPLFIHEDYDFFRGEPMYVSFQVHDLNGNFANDIVTRATLVSPPGGRAVLQQIQGPAIPNVYFFELVPIPPTHDFLGISQVFTFALNFVDNTGGQAQVDLTIRNNPPRIGLIPPIITSLFQSVSIDLRPFEFDVEDSGTALLWSFFNLNPGLYASQIAGKVLTVTPLQIGESIIDLRLTDLDGDFASQIVPVIILNGSGPGPRPVPPFVDDDDELLRISGIRFDKEEYLPGDYAQVYVSLENDGDDDLDNLKITITELSLGIRGVSSNFDLDENDEDTIQVFLDIPSNVKPGSYDLRFTVSNDKIERVKYRPLDIVS